MKSELHVEGSSPMKLVVGWVGGKPELEAPLLAKVDLRFEWSWERPAGRADAG